MGNHNNDDAITSKIITYILDFFNKFNIYKFIGGIIWLSKKTLEKYRKYLSVRLN